MKSSIIIPIRNAELYLLQCLNALKLLNPPPFEIILVLDGNQPKSREICQKYYFKLLEITEPQGCENARNVGARAANGELLIFLDADVVVGSNLIALIENKFSLLPTTAALFGSYDIFPVEENFLSQFRNLLHHYIHQTSKISASTFWTGCGAIRKNIFSALGGFNISLGPGSKDIELGYRIIESGETILLCKEIQVRHLKKWTFLQTVKTDILLRAMPWTEIILSRKGKFIDDLNISKKNRYSVLLACLIPFFLILNILSSSKLFPLIICLLSFIILITINSGFYIFLYKIRGAKFALYSLLYHSFYFFYSGIGFVLGFLKYYSKLLLIPRTTTLIRELRDLG